MTAIRPATAADADAIRGVNARAFGGDHGVVVAELVDILTAGPMRVSLVAELDGTVVGHTMLSRGWIDAERELVETLVLSPLSVEPEHHGHGIGGELVRAALAAAEQAGSPAVFLEGSPMYYSRFGFEFAVPRGFVPPSPRVPDPAFQLVVLPAWQDWMTGQLVYPEAFWATDTVGLRGEQLADVRAQIERARERAQAPTQ